jgi:hypothetical protein
MRRAPCLILAVSLLVSCAARQTAPPAGELAFHDLMPEYWRWWSGVEKLAPEQQADSFLATVARAHPEIYNATVLGSAFADQGSARDLARHYFGLVPEFLPAMRSTSQRMPELLRNGYARFRQRFPDLRWNGPVQVIPSLLSFDGGTRTVLGRTNLFFAPDGIARYHQEGVDLCAFFAHEFFHIYQDQFLPEAVAPQRDPLWRALWSEGLATYVSGQLCAGTTEAGVLMSPTLAADTRAVLPQVLKELRAQLHSTDQKVYRRFFAGQPTDIPFRAGYYAGYLVARRAARSQALERLPRLEASVALGLVEAGLDELLREP